MLNNALGDATVTPGETLYWTYWIIAAPNASQPWLSNNVGLCYAMPQPQLGPEENGKFWTLMQGTGQMDASVQWYINIQSDPGNTLWLQYDLQIACFEI